MAVAASGGAMAQTEAVHASEIIYGVQAMGISPNGQWVVGQADGEGLVYVENLKTNETYVTGGATTGVGYVLSVGKPIANDGTVIALKDGFPYYWTPTGTSKGTWKQLPGPAADGSVMMGSISPDGSIIIGSNGSTGTTTEDILMTNPCIWYRNENGTYDEPVRLPFPKRDPFGRVPQYLNLISMSDDGSVIAALMVDWSGVFNIPYIFTKGEDGKWSYDDVGTGLVLPEGLEIVNDPGDFKGPSQPNPWDYLNEAQTNAFWNAFPSWANSPDIAKLPLEEQTLKQLEFMAEFMSPDKKEDYLSKLYPFLDAMNAYNEQFKAYYEFRDRLREEGTSFMMNNAWVSPDGKYAYFTGENTVVKNPELGEEGVKNHYAPVRFSVETGEPTKYDTDGQSLVVTSVSADYSVFCRIVGVDDFWPSESWVFPGESDSGMSFPDFIMDNGSAEAYEWMEENMYRECIIGSTATGAYQYDDRWTVGNLYTTPDMSLIVCANSTLYWGDGETMPNFVSFLLNTGYDPEKGNGEGPGEGPGGEGAVDEVIAEEGTPVYYDLQGRKVVNAERGIYVKVINGKAEKIIK